MAEEIDDGGSAFPTQGAFRAIGEVSEGDAGIPGMSVRDWFAGMALQGMVVASSGFGVDYQQYSAVAYDFADSMLKARRP